MRHTFAEPKKLNLEWFNVMSITLNSLDENRLEHQCLNATLICQNRAKDKFISLWQVSEGQHNRKLRFYNETKDTIELELYLALTTAKKEVLVYRQRKYLCSHEPSGTSKVTLYV